jgi:hypothetical protein
LCPSDIPRPGPPLNPSRRNKISGLPQCVSPPRFVVTPSLSSPFHLYGHLFGKISTTTYSILKNLHHKKSLLQIGLPLSVTTAPEFATTAPEKSFHLLGFSFHYYWNPNNLNHAAI